MSLPVRPCSALASAFIFFHSLTFTAVRRSQLVGLQGTTLLGSILPWHTCRAKHSISQVWKQGCRMIQDTIRGRLCPANLQGRQEQLVAYTCLQFRLCQESNLTKTHLRVPQKYAKVYKICESIPNVQKSYTLVLLCSFEVSCKSAKLLLRSCSTAQLTDTSWKRGASMHSSKDLSALGGDSLIEEAHGRNKISGSSGSCNPNISQHSQQDQNFKTSVFNLFQSQICQMDNVCKLSVLSVEKENEIDKVAAYICLPQIETASNTCFMHCKAFSVAHWLSSVQRAWFCWKELPILPLSTRSRHPSLPRRSMTLAECFISVLGQCCCDSAQCVRTRMFWQFTTGTDQLTNSAWVISCVAISWQLEVITGASAILVEAEMVEDGWRKFKEALANQVPGHASERANFSKEEDLRLAYGRSRANVRNWFLDSLHWGAVRDVLKHTTLVAG